MTMILAAVVLSILLREVMLNARLHHALQPVLVRR